MAEKLTVHTDGGARGNPGPAGAGIVIVNAKGDIMKKLSKFLGEGTNNWAEYEAVFLALKELKKLFGSAKIRHFDVEVKMDSELVASQLRNEYQVKEKTLFPQFIKVHNLLVKDFPNIKFTHVSRGENKEADKLANEAMDQGAQRTMFGS